MTRFDDLSEADQAAVRAALGRGGGGKVERTIPKPTTAGSTGPCPVACHTCGEKFDHWGVAVERHRDRYGHHRYDLALTDPSDGLGHGGNLDPTTPTPKELNQ